MSIDFGKLEEQIRERGKVEVLENGAVLITEDMPGTGIAKGKIEVLAGSLQESKQDEGVMHFIEHVCFEGSKNHPSTSKIVKAALPLGVQINAHTNIERVGYPVLNPKGDGYLLNEKFPKAFELISDLAFNPLFRPKSIEKQRETIIAEIKDSEFHKAAHRDIYKKIELEINKALFPEKPELWEERKVLGTQASVQNISADTLRAYHAKFFVASNVVATISGDNNSVDIFNKAKSNLLSISAGIQAPYLSISKDIEINSERIINIDLQAAEVIGQQKDNNMARVGIIYQVPTFTSPEASALEALAYIMGSGSHSILFHELREKKRFYSLNARYENEKKSGYLIFHYSLPEEKLEDSLKGFQKGVQRAKDGNFSGDILEAYKSSQIPVVLSKLQQPGWILNELKQRHLKERQEGLPTYFDRIRADSALTKEAVVRVANQYLGNNRIIIIAK
jgi:predicted Zn-dependent peptidase